MEGIEETRKLSTNCLASEKTSPGSIKDPTRIPQKANDRNQQGPVSLKLSPVTPPLCSSHQ